MGCSHPELPLWRVCLDLDSSKRQTLGQGCDVGDDSKKHGYGKREMIQGRKLSQYGVLWLVLIACFFVPMMLKPWWGLLGDRINHTSHFPAQRIRKMRFFNSHLCLKVILGRDINSLLPLIRPITHGLRESGGACSRMLSEWSGTVTVREVWAHAERI